MYKFYKSNFFRIILIILIISINSQINTTDLDATDNVTEYSTCSLYEDCSSCIFCGNFTEDYSLCNFDNIFCEQRSKKNYQYNSDLKSKYSNFFRKDAQINSFCGKRDINLNSMEKTFTVLETYFNSDLLSRKIHCDYIISNKYYLKHETDQANLKIEIKKTGTGNNAENNKIKFNFFMIYELDDKSLRFATLNDQEFRKNAMNKILDKVKNIEILIDFNNDINDLPLEEVLEISIITDNPSKKNRIIYISILVVCCFLLLLIIVLIVIYILIRRKMNIRNRDNNEEMIEKEKRREENKKKMDKLYQNELKPKKFNDSDSNGCNICSICCDEFENGKSDIIDTPCHHIFHEECLKKWVDTNILDPFCPNCKYNFVDNIKDFFYF